MQVFFTFAVARLAIGCAGICLYAVFGLIDSQDRFSLTFVMALRASLIFFHGCGRHIQRWWRYIRQNRG